MSYIAIVAENYENQFALDAEAFGPFNTEQEADEWLERHMNAIENDRDKQFGEWMGHAFTLQIKDPE